MTSPKEAVVPIAEIHRDTGLCRKSIYTAIDRGELPGSKVVGKYLVPRGAWEAWKQGHWTPQRQPTPLRSVGLARKAS